MRAGLHPVSDLTDAHLLNYLRQGGESESRIVATVAVFSVIDVVTAVQRAANKDFAVHMGPRRSGDPAALVARADRSECSWLGAALRSSRLHRRPCALLGGKRDATI